MTHLDEMNDLKQRIASVFAKREHLKDAMSQGQVAPHEGFRDLEALDSELSDLDSRFKHLWDTQQRDKKFNKENYEHAE